MQKQTPVKPEPEELVAAFPQRKANQSPPPARFLVRVRSCWRSPHSESGYQWLLPSSRRRCSPTRSRHCRGLSLAPAPRGSWPPSGSPEPLGATARGVGVRGGGGTSGFEPLRRKRITRGRRRMSPRITIPFWVWYVYLEPWFAI